MEEQLVRNNHISVSMQLMSFPIIGNFATTRHKLQGKSMDNLIIAEWRNVQNWAYVVLSWVRMLAGLFLWEPLPEDFSFAPEPDYLSMMEHLHKTIITTPINEA